MQKNWKRNAVFGLIALLLLGVLFNLNLINDYWVWKQFQDRLSDGQVQEVIIVYRGDQRLELAPAEEKQVLESIRRAEFAESNRTKFGSTASGHILIRFQDGTDEHIAYYGGLRFEISPHVIDTESQFWIESEILKKFIELKNIPI